MNPSSRSTRILGVATFALLAQTAFSSPVDSLTDVFPLHRGLTYTYEFKAKSDWFEDPVGKLFVDSGRVQYHVQDSFALGDTAIQWCIIQVSDLLTHRQIFPPSPPSLDTLYQTRDTIALQLIEKLSGNHQLVCNGRVWDFPLKDLRGLQHDSVYRFANTQEFQLLSAWSYPNWGIFYGHGSDSLVFSSLLGFLYRKQVETWGTGYYYGADELIIREIGNPQSVPGEPTGFPVSMSLYQNYPNPFNSTTIIEFELPVAAILQLQIYNSLGQLIQSLYSGRLGAGFHRVTWEARNQPTGIYICRLVTAGHSQSVKLVLVK